MAKIFVKLAGIRAFYPNHSGFAPAKAGNGFGAIGTNIRPARLTSARLRLYERAP